MSKPRKNDARVSKRKSSGTTKKTKKVMTADYPALKDWKNGPPSLPELVDWREARLGSDPVARGLAYYDIGRMLLVPYQLDLAADVLSKIRVSDEWQTLCFLSMGWDRAELELELATPMADGTLPNINYFAALTSCTGPSPERKALVKQMRSESLSLKDFWIRIKAFARNKYPQLNLGRLAWYRLDDGAVDSATELYSHAVTR